MDAFSMVSLKTHLASFLLIIFEDLQKSPVLERLKVYFHDTLKDYSSPFKCIFCLLSEMKMRDKCYFSM